MRGLMPHECATFYEGIEMSPHDCRSCCMNRRECLKVVSASALGAALLLPGRGSRAVEKAESAPDDFVDPAALRPKPAVRIAATFLEMPRPYWLGWPGTTYDLETHQKQYRSALDESAQRLGLQVSMEAAPISSEEAVTAWVKKVATQPPDALLVMLQHMQCWNWATRIAKETGIPLLVFAPVGTAFTGHIDNGSRAGRVHVISTLDWSAVEDALRMVKAKRLFEETRLLWIRSNQRNETVLDRLGVKVRAIPRDYVQPGV